MTSLPSIRPIGDRPLSLVPHLKATIDLLLDERTAYQWNDTARCNAGLLARVITGFSYDQMREALGQATTTMWKALVKPEVLTCPYLQVGKRWGDVLRTLLEAGLEPEDAEHLEGLSHPELLGTTLCVKPGWMARYVSSGGSAYSDPAAVAGYLQRWVAAIETYRAAHPLPSMAAPQTTEAEMEAIETRPLVEARS